jgi:hypothetical protein
MMQQFLNAIAGKNEKPFDPMESLIPKHLLGERNNKPWFYGLLGVSSFALVVTVSEVHPIFNQVIMGMYLLLVVGAIVDLMKAYQVNNYITKTRIQLYAVFYAAIGLGLTFVIELVKNI